MHMQFDISIRIHVLEDMNNWWLEQCLSPKLSEKLIIKGGLDYLICRCLWECKSSHEV